MTHSTQTRTVYVVDDDASIRAGLKDLLDSVSLATHVFATTHDFLSHPRAEAPSCLILDIRMPGQSGTDFYRQMQRLEILMPVIFITGHGDIAMGVKAIKDGAADFLTKPFRDQDLLDAVHAALERDRLRLERDQASRSLQERWRSLTPGERDVVLRVVRGELNKQIAAALDIQEITVKVRRAKAMKKMEAGSLAELVTIILALSP